MDANDYKTRLATSLSMVSLCYLLSEQRKNDPEAVENLLEYWKGIVRCQTDYDLRIIRHKIKQNPFYQLLMMIPDPDTLEEFYYSNYTEFINHIEHMINQDWADIDVDREIETLIEHYDKNFEEATKEEEK